MTMSFVAMLFSAGASLPAQAESEKKVIKVFVKGNPGPRSRFLQLDSEKQKGSCADLILGSDTECVDIGRVPDPIAPEMCNVSRTGYHANDPRNCDMRNAIRDAGRKPASKRKP